MKNERKFITSFLGIFLILLGFLFLKTNSYAFNNEFQVEEIFQNEFDYNNEFLKFEKKNNVYKLFNKEAKIEIIFDKNNELKKAHIKQVFDNNGNKVAFNDLLENLGYILGDNDILKADINIKNKKKYKSSLIVRKDIKKFLFSTLQEIYFPEFRDFIFRGNEKNIIEFTIFKK